MKYTATILLTLGFAASASAQVCEQSSLQENLHYLRQLSLDLRGRLPDMAELDSVVTNGAIDPAVITGMVRSEDVVTTLREFYKALLWTNISDVRLSDANWSLTRTQTTNIYYNNNRAIRYRGGSTRMPCLDEAARFDANGQILTTPDTSDPNILREGWVMVTPYWDPTTQVKVCAFDAQAALSVTDARGRVLDCRTTGSTQKACGCGPNMNWCHSGPDRTEATITSAMAEQGHRLIDKIVREGRPYTELLTTKEYEINGPISHYLRYQTSSGLARVYVTEENNYSVPAIPFNQPNTWMPTTATDLHSGILTLPIYLLKFQSDRGRANRFYNAFLCSYFKVPDGTVLPSADDPCTQEVDLTKRCGCKYCHVAVEPAAANWGRFAEAGVAPLNIATYPSYNAACAAANASSNATCKRLYLYDPGSAEEEPFKGWLRSYVFADDERKHAAEAGPINIAQTAIDNGAFAACATRKMWERYLARETDDTLDADALNDLTNTFKNSNYDLRVLIEAIVKRPEYIQAGRFDGKGTSR
ncbi:MAG: hypothetical protein U1E65_23170 [Myxococcota bacterium]